MMSNKCYLNLDLLPKDVFRILYDSNLIVNFLKQMEKEKLEALEIKKELVVKLCKINI